MTESKKPAINYTNRDFQGIKKDLVNYARRYYPNQFKNFSANSFGSLMLDTIALVGDQLSFYLDYQVNEGSLSTALEYDNILKLSRENGYKADLSPSSYGTLTFFVLIPASNGAPNMDYAPVLKRGSSFKTSNGKIFTLLEDVNFADEERVEIVVGEVDNTTGVPTSYAVRARGQAVSGELALKRFELGDYVRYRTLEVVANNISEIVSVEDSEGNRYYEVDYLTQNTIYIPIINRGDDKDTVANILKPISVPRRFTVTKSRKGVTLQFGAGTNEDKEKILDPSNVLIEQHGRDYVTDDSFDPGVLLKTDKLGVSPFDTQMTVVYRVNTTENTNADVGTITEIVGANFDFKDFASLTDSLVTSVEDSLEVVNEVEFVGDNPFPSADEIKQRAMGVYSMQNRIVTKEDFMAAAYSMPPKFGAIKKVGVAQDNDTFNQRNVNLYVLSEDSLGKLVVANNTIKNNLKTHLSKYKMINDTIDIIDGKIVNLRVNFKITPFSNVNKFSALEEAKRDLENYFLNRVGYELGEPFSISDLYAVLKNTASVLDVITVSIDNVSGGNYSDLDFDVDEHTTADGRRITSPPDTCFEIKFPNADIVGEVV